MEPATRILDPVSRNLSAKHRRYVGRHEDESMRLWKIIAAHVPRGKAILDIGAFEGENAVGAGEVSQGAKITAFGPGD